MELKRAYDTDILVRDLKELNISFDDDSDDAKVVDFRAKTTVSITKEPETVKDTEDTDIASAIIQEYIP